MNVYWLSSATGNPPTFFKQNEIYEKAKYERFPERTQEKIAAIFKLAQVEMRSIFVPEWGLELSDDPDDFHKRYVAGVRSLVPGVAKAALSKVGLAGSDIDFVVFTSCTGFTCPGFSVELAHQLGVPDDRPTANLLGIGCSALIPAIRTASDRLRSNPGTRALVVAAEICSAMYWVDDTLEMAVGNATFGDGAAAIVLSSKPQDLGRAMAKIDGFRSLRDGRYLEDMGFTQKSGRLRLKLSRELPEHIVPMAEKMLDQLEVPDGSRIAFHPGGRKILDLLSDALIPRSESWKPVLQWSRSVLRDFGNMSSATGAFVMERSIEERPITRGEVGGLITMGPGISVEGARMTWL